MLQQYFFLKKSDGTHTSSLQPLHLKLLLLYHAFTSSIPNSSLWFCPKSNFSNFDQVLENILTFTKSNKCTIKMDFMENF